MLHKVKKLGTFEKTENTVLVFKPIRVMSDKELAILETHVAAQGKKLGVETIIVPFSAEILVDEDPNTDDSGNGTDDSSNGLDDSGNGEDKLTEDELRAKAKELGVQSAHNKAIDKIKEEIKVLEANQE